MDISGAKVLVTGGGGFLGRRLMAALSERGANPVAVRSSEYDLTDRAQVRAMLADLAPQAVIHAAAVVGGIGANRAEPARFFHDNMAMGLFLIDEAWNAGIEKLVVVGTVCSYPKFAEVPFTEDSLWDGFPEETNAPYGMAKKMLLVQGQAYRAEHGFNCVHVIPSNMYGPNDNFDLGSSHVIPAMIRKFVEANESGGTVTLWGTGRASREFLYVDDAAVGLVLALEQYDDPEPINLGVNSEITIADLAAKIGELTGFAGSIEWDGSKPDGQPRRAVDGSKAERLLGWKPQVSLDDGLRQTIDWFLATRASTSA
jgi:GDP-L-fucose synthase